jgi:acetyl-CoA acyltransferase
MTVDRKCGSAEAALHVGYAQIASGVNDIVVAGGAENMTRVPMGGNRDVHGKPFGWKLLAGYPQIPQGEAAERLVDKYGFTRDDVDNFAFTSHHRAAAAADNGYFDREIVAVPVASWCENRESPADVTLSRDETIRRDTTREKLRYAQDQLPARRRTDHGRKFLADL